MPVFPAFIGWNGLEYLPACFLAETKCMEKGVSCKRCLQGRCTQFQVWRQPERFPLLLAFLLPPVTRRSPPHPKALQLRRLSKPHNIDSKSIGYRTWCTCSTYWFISSHRPSENSETIGNSTPIILFVFVFLLELWKLVMWRCVGLWGEDSTGWCREFGAGGSHFGRH